MALELGDDCLVLGQRLAEWASRAPTLEEDVALLNISLDLLGVARTLYAGLGDEDELAYERREPDFRNCLLVELPNAGPAAGPHAPIDFGVTMARLLFVSTYQLLLYQSLLDSSDERLRDIAAKARKESAYHVDHATQWTIRLGDGTEESHRRMQAAVDDLWPYTHELFTGTAPSGLVPDPASLRAPWLESVTDVLTVSTLTTPPDGWAPSGGRDGRHTEHLSYLLAEMQVLHRAHPGATW